MTSYHKGDRLNEAQRKGFGVQRTVTINYQLKGEVPRRFVMEQYAPVARGKGKLVQAYKESANMLIREMSLEYVRCFEMIDGIVKFSYDIGDKRDE